MFVNLASFVASQESGSLNTHYLMSKLKLQFFCENHAKPKSEFSESYAKCDIYRYKALLIYMLPQKKH